LVTAVWGQEYVDTFVRVGLRSLLSQGNIPDLAVEHEVLYTIYTMQPDAQTLERAPAFARLRESANVSLSLFDPREIDTTNYGEHGTFWWRAIDLARRNGEVLFFIIPDLLYASGTPSTSVRAARSSCSSARARARPACSGSARARTPTA